MSNFFQQLQTRFQQDCMVCVGLDSDPAKLPATVRGTTIGERMLMFNQEIIEATAPYACAFKPQSAVYEAYGREGLEALQKTVAYIKDDYPEIPVILDAKRADIGSTNQWYVKNIFEELRSDAVTVQPYLGGEALQPFLDQKDKGIIVLCHTSNPGAAELQELKVAVTADLFQGPSGSYGGSLKGESELPLYLYLALRVANHWNQHNNCALVMGATYPEQLAQLRGLLPEMPLLIPGVGAQGGDLAAVVQAARTRQGEGMIINASRAVIFASNGPDFAQAAAGEAKRLNQLINQHRKTYES